MPYITQVAAGKREKLSIFGSDYDTLDAWRFQVNNPSGYEIEEVQRDTS